MRAIEHDTMRLATVMPDLDIFVDICSHAAGICC
jgi:hypothetical protein